jgi:sec-independent protein translocase protein TatB
MDFFGVGASELVFIILIAIIILGPKDMQKAGRTIGRWLNQLVRSDSWKVFQRTSNEIRNLPRNLMREANMEMMEAEKEVRRALDPRPNPSISPSLNQSPELPPRKEEETTSPGEPTTSEQDAPAVAGGDDPDA